jgi:hypothetical protein
VEVVLGLFLCGKSCPVARARVRGICFDFDPSAGRVKPRFEAWIGGCLCLRVFFRFLGHLETL